MTDHPMSLSPTLFDVPNIRTKPPVAPGSESSRKASLDLSSPFRRETWRRIMVLLASVYPKPLSREQIAERVGQKESALCARISELRPLWIQQHDGAVKAASGLMVDGYSLTPAGKARCDKALTGATNG